jgi:LacI family transcriptional regulator
MTVGGAMSTIYDVARSAGVSAKTVSRVLNGDAPVGKETRIAVEKAMGQLGYVPSNAARMMRSNKSGLVGLITGAISMSPEPMQPAGLPELFIVQGIQKALAGSGMTLMIADTGGVMEKAAPLIDTFLRHRVEGLIYVAEFHQKVTLPRVPDDVALVLANCYDDHGTTAILPDDRLGQFDLVTQIIAAGHRRIAYLTLRPDVEAGHLRALGYRDALAAHGIAFDPAIVAACDLPDRAAESRLLMETIDRMMRLPDPPTILCCGTDKMALEVYGILRTLGLRLPEEISVAGYDNYRVIAEQLYPPLTTVTLPYPAMGELAAQRLLSLIAGNPRNDPAVERVAGPVCWRASVKDLSCSKPDQTEPKWRTLYETI